MTTLGPLTPGLLDDVLRDVVLTDAERRLIAAAPDLYAAILYSDDAHWTPAMRAAMAKAEGRP